jgi:hypothetical protein
MAGTTAIQDPPDKVKKVYDAVSKKFDVGTLDEFKSDMKDPSKNKKVYDVVSKDFDIGSYDQFQKDLGAGTVKKKDASGSPALSDSSPKPEQTAPPVNTSGSDPKQVAKNFKNNTLTPSDVGDKPLGEFLGPSPEQLTGAINNKGKNLDSWQKAPTENYVTALVNQRNDVRRQIAEKTDAQFRGASMSLNPNTLKDLQRQEQYLSGQIQKSYDYQKAKLVPELAEDVKSAVGDDNLKFNPETHMLDEKSTRLVVDRVDAIMNKKKDPVVNAAVSGDFDDKPRTYEDISKGVIDQLNTIPIKKAQNEFAEKFAEKNPHIKEALAVNKDINDYFSSENFDAVKARVKIGVDKSLTGIQGRYYDPGGLFSKNQDYVGIQEKYAKLVGEGKMSDSVAKKQIDVEIENNPSLKTIKANYDAEVKKTIDDASKQYEKYVIGGLVKKHPEYTTYKDGTIGLSALSEDQYTNMVEGYHEGMDDIAKKMGAESNAAWKRMANEKAAGIGPLWGSLGMELNDIEGGLRKVVFNKTGWGGEKMRHFEAADIAAPNISQSDIAAGWNWKGWESLIQPSFYLSGVGKMVPIIAGGAAIEAATEGAGTPEYISWLANAGLFTAQNSLSTYNQLLNSKDANGNMVSESDAAHTAADQAAKDFAPNLLMMAMGSGTVFRAKNIMKPTIGRALAEGATGVAIQQPFFAWQGYNDYATMQEANGKQTDIYDYMQSKDFRDNMLNGMIMGGAFSLMHTPLNYMKSMDNWTKMVHTSEGEFKNMIPQNYALSQEFAGQGNYLRDALKLHIFNADLASLNAEGRRNLQDLKDGLLYSTNLDRVIRQGNLDPKNITELYQAHNAALADQHEYQSEQAAKEGNKSLSDIYKDKAKNYREQAKAAANGEAKFTYLVNADGHPIFMSDKSFQTLEQEGTIAQWQKDGTIQGVHKSDDPEFAQRYKDFVTAKDEATVQGGDIMDHAKGLIEKHKDKLGGWYDVAKEHPDEFYNSVAGLVFGRNSDGSKSNVPGNEKSAREQFGDDIVDLAKVMFPETAEAQISKSSTINPIMQRINNAEYVNENDLNKASDELYDILDKNDKNKNLTEEQKKSVANLVEPLISKIEGYEFRTKTETGTVTEKVPTYSPRTPKQREIRPALEQSSGSAVTVTQPDGGVRKGTLDIKGGQYVVDVPGGDQIVIGEKAITDRDLKLPTEEEMENPIAFDKDGNVESVTFKTRNGSMVTVSDPEKALDLAIQLRAEAVGEVPDAEFDTVWNEVQKQVQREVPVHDISSPKPENDGKTSDEANGQQKVNEKKEPDKITVNGDQPAPSSTLPPKTPPPANPPAPAPIAGSPKEEFTGNTKAKNREIEGAKEIFEKQGVIHWSETFSNALSNVMARYPDKSWYEALKNHVNYFAGLVDRGVKFNPTSEDHAAFLMFKHETLRQLGALEGWDSPDDFQRQLADIKDRELRADLLNAVRVTNPGGETGRALQILQAEIGGDVQNGLKIRRIDRARDKGAPLNAKEFEETAEDWEKEKAIIQKENELKLQRQQEKFDKQIAKLKGEKPLKFDREKASKVATNLRGIADKVEKFLKADLPEGTQRMGADIQKKVADAIRWVADKIEKGDIRIPDIISAAIEKFKGEKDENELRDGITKGMVAAGVDEKMVKADTDRKASFEKIKTAAAAEGTTEISNSMAGKNLIRDYVKSHVGLTENADIIGKVTEELKKVLPDVTENQVIKAYLKEDEFKQPTKKELEGSLRDSQRKFESLTKLEKDINDLKEKQTLFKRNSAKHETPVDKELEAKEKERNNLMDVLGVKVASEDKYTKASYDQRAKSHNQRLDDLSAAIQKKIEGGGLTDEQKSALLNLKGKVDNSKVNLNPDSAESQEKTLKGGVDVLKSISSEFARKTDKDIAKMSDIRRGLQKVIDGFDSDKNESTQDIKLKRAKDQAKRDMDKYFNKISNNEYEDNPIVELTKTDAQLIKLEREKGAIYQIYKDRQQAYAKQRKQWAKKTGDFLRAAEVGYLIGSPFTIAKVGASALLRPQLEALSKMGYHYTIEQLPFELNRILTERAKLGGESTSLASIRKGYQAYLKQYGEEGLKKLYATANDKFEKASQAYMDQEKEVNRVKYMGMDKPEYSEATKRLQKLKNERDAALVDAVGNSIYQFIAGSSLKESLEVFLHRSTALERNFGDFDREAWDAKGKGKLVTGASLADIDNWNYLINGIGRSHAALKNFSGRFSFATEFMSRLEYYSKQGVDISTPDKLLEIAHESYGGWERGKYQESNWISDKWNKLTRDIEKNNPEMAYLMKADVAITRVPVNMLYEGIMEYTLGGLTGSVIAAKEYYKARKMTLQYQFGPEEQTQFRQELHDQLRKMDPKAAAAIVRAYRKQGFGMGMYALFLLGHGAFGGFAHKGQTAEDKKKALREIQTGNPEIKTGEIKLGDWTMPNAAAKIIEHTPGFQMPLMALGLSQVYENSIIDGKSTPEAVKDAALAHVNHIVNSIPQAELVMAIGGGLADKVIPYGQWNDVDQDGMPMKRRAFRAADYFQYLHLPFTDGFKKDILSENYYKEAVKTQTQYRNAITDIETNTSLSKEEKEEQRQEQLKQLNSDIDEIYRQNKENTQ